VLNTGSLSITSIVMCVGETVQTPTAYGITFTNGMKRRVLTYDCPQNPPQTQDVVVVYVPSAVTYVDGSGNPMPSVFTNAGTYYYTGQAYGTAVDGVCGNTAVFNIGTLTVQVWGTGDSDYDGFSDCQEAKDGTDPYSSGLLTEMWLGYWRFNDTNWLGDFGQIPVTHTNLQSVPGLNVKAVGVNSNTVARLTYRDVETNGWANVNVRQGTIRFWFRPSWASTNSGGTGPQTETRLFEMGDEVVGSPTGWWALVMNNAGNQIRFVTQTNAVGRTNLMASVNLSAEQWYQIAITYSSTNSRLYVNGQAVGTNGLGVAHYPGPSIRNQGFRVGSDKDGNRQAKGRFDDLETFNYAQSAQTISNVYAWRAAQMATNTPNLNSCVLRPITIKHSIMSTVAVNSTFTIQRGTGPGNFSWVEGNKHDHTNPKVLADQLTNSTGFAYIRSDNAADDVVSIGDWISGVPGNKKAIHIREALNYLITNQIPITLPVWSTNRNPGANMEYQVTNFAQVRVISYTNLDENELHKSNFTFTFFYLGNQVCETRTNTAPQVSAGSGQTICFGASATLAGAATDDGLPAPAGLTFAWSKVSGPGTPNFVNQGATNTSVSFTLPGIYRLQLLASDGELTGVDTVDINVQTNTTAVGPGSQTQCPGANVVFSTTPSGTGPFTYVWLKDGSVLAGQTSSSLTLNNITVASGGTYTVRVTGTCGSVTNNAMLTVYTPTTATGPSNLIRNPGQNATFTVTAAGAAPFSYVWRKDGVVIPGQTTSSLNLGNVTLANAGT